MIRNEEILSVKQRFGIIGNAAVLNNAIRVAVQVAPTEMTVLITGESGSGKESFSKIIHHLSSRKHNPFIAINCGAIPEGTIDSELFGHEKGAFTGAVDARKGYFEETNGGTIFLDEIGEMPVSTQARLLRVLENGEYIRVGSSKVLKTNVRVIAATNVNLLDAVEKGKFREDLYYRLNTVPIYVPPLRERGNDIDLLFRKFAADFSDKYHIKPIALDEAAKIELLNFPFPGNIRQLKNLADQISALEMERNISVDVLRKYLPNHQRSGLPALIQQQEGPNAPISEREILYKVLFDMKKDMNELKKIVYEAVKNDDLDSSTLEQHKELFKDIDVTKHQESFSQYSLPPSSEHESSYAKSPSNNTIDIDDTDIHEIHEVEDQSLSLVNKERELIEKALKKNNNKRKYAAKDLGISERTLYRKIKQYGIG